MSGQYDPNRIIRVSEESGQKKLHEDDLGSLMPKRRQKGC